MKTLIISITILFISSLGGAFARQCQTNDELLINDFINTTIDKTGQTQTSCSEVTPYVLSKEALQNDIPPDSENFSGEGLLNPEIKAEEDNYADHVQYDLKSAFYNYSLRQMLHEEGDPFSDRVQSAMNVEFNKYTFEKTAMSDDDPYTEHVQAEMKAAFNKYSFEQQIRLDEDSYSENIQDGMKSAFYSYAFSQLKNSYNDEAYVDDIPFSTSYYTDLYLAEKYLSHFKLKADAADDIPGNCKVEIVGNQLHIDCDLNETDLPVRQLQIDNSDFYHELMDVLIRHAKLLHVEFDTDF
jgi:hypothetical protein